MDMKKLFLLFVIMIACVSCYDVPSKEGKVNDSFYVSNVGYIDYVEFDGHQYVQYYDGYRGSLCHSPKCPCLNKD